MWWLSEGVYLCLFFNVQYLQAVSVEIIRPPSTRSAPEVVVIMLPGYSISGEAYIGLGHAIQANSSFNVWVALTTGYPSNVTTYPDVEIAIDLALTKLRKEGVSMDNIFIAGHSFGGAIAQDYASMNARKFKGVLLFACYLAKWNRLEKFPLPVLTLSGDLDGMNRLTRLLDTFMELVDLDVDSRLTKPIVIVPGMNHGHFADPPLTPNVLEYDIKSDVKRSEVLSEVGNIVNWFMVTTLGEPLSDITEARNMLKQEFQLAREIFEPLQSVRLIDQKEWPIQAQELAAGINISSDPEIQIVNKVLFSEELVNVTACVEKYGGKVKVNTFTHEVLSVNTLDQSLMPQSPLEMMLKMVTQDSIREKLPTAHLMPPMTCEQINQEALQVVLGKISKIALERWNKRSRPITWNKDTLVQSEDDWLNTALSLTDMKKNGGLQVKSVSWSTAINSWPFNFAGIQYCKLISPFRVLEWIYIDSLRYTQP